MSSSAAAAPPSHAKSEVAFRSVAACWRPLALGWAVHVGGHALLAWPLARELAAVVAGLASQGGGEEELGGLGGLLWPDVWERGEAWLAFGGGVGLLRAGSLLGPALLELLPRAMLVASLATGGKGGSAGGAQQGAPGALGAWRVGGQAVPAWVLLFLLSLVAQVLLGALVLFGGRLLLGASGWQPPTSDLAWAGLILGGLTLLVVVRCAFDLARVAVVDRGLGAFGALRAAWSWLSPRLVGAFVLRGALGVGAFVAAGALAQGQGGLGTLVLHALGTASVQLVQADWLRVALCRGRRLGWTPPGLDSYPP